MDTSTGFVVVIESRRIYIIAWRGCDGVKKDGISMYQVAATYIGVVVGAGFATGQEILQFFARFGIMGIAGLTATTLLFILFGSIAMNLGRTLDARSHLEIIYYAGGRKAGAVMDALITFFLFGGLTAMIAGTGALFHQQFDLPGLTGNLLMCVLTALTVMTGINGIINSISFVVPFLLISVIVISIPSILSSPPDLLQASGSAGGNGLISNWLVSAILYVSFNTITSIAVLGPLGVQARNRKAVRWGAVLGGLGLAAASFLICLALLGRASEITGLEIPMLHIAGCLSPKAQLIFTIILIAEIYTTAVGCLYGFASRLSAVKTIRINTLIVLSTAAALLASQLGFTNLVRYYYPIEGYGGMVLLASLLYARFGRKAGRRHVRRR